MKFNISKDLNFSGYIKSIKTCNIPLKTSIKMVTMNAEKKINFSTFDRFLGPFLKKQCFSKNGNFERDEKF